MCGTRVCIRVVDSDGSREEVWPPTECELRRLFLPYEGFCARKGIQAKNVVLHDIDIPSALVDYIIHNSIANFVVGASRHNALMRKFRHADIPASLLKSAPESCALYVISKGKVQYSHPANQARTPISNAALPKGLSLMGLPTGSEVGLEVKEISQDVFIHQSSDSDTDRTSLDIISHSSKISPIVKVKSDGDITSTPLSLGRHGNETLGSLSRASISEGCDVPCPRNFLSTDIPDEKSKLALECSTVSSSQSPECLEAEINTLRDELKKTMELYNMVSQDAATAERRAKELQGRKAAGEHKLERVRLAEGAASELIEAERQKTTAAMEAAQMAHQLADLEAQRRQLAEMKAKHEGDETKRAWDQLAGKKAMYKIYSIEEIEIATDYFAESHKIAEGGYGPVFRGMLDQTPVAIKVVRPGISEGQKLFRQEVGVLSCMRHPHLVLLLGACPEYGCIVYEYMENGNLEDMLFRKDNTPSTPWNTRFRVAAEIATALNFLHQTKPEPLVHRDLKPANILLDRNNVSKIGDVGLARLVPPSIADKATQYCMTAAAGTLFYIDPEYQQTGMLGVKSDLYSFGIVLLQLITARGPVGLAIQVQEAIEKGTLQEVLDPTVPDWPIEDTLSLATLALQCCELRKKDRPDLGTIVLPELNRLRDLGSENKETITEHIISEPHSHHSVPETETQSSQVYTRHGLRDIKYKHKMWNMRKAGIFPPCGKQHVERKSRRKSADSACWSFMSCSGNSGRQQIREFQSFS